MLTHEPLAGQTTRPKLAPFFLLPAVILTGGAYLSGGEAPLVTDLGFFWMTLCCIGFVVVEIMKFRERQGWGAIVMYGGVLVWFCHDYLKHWNTTFFLFGWEGIWARQYPEAMPTVSWMAFLYTLFVTLMAFGATLRVPDRILRWMRKYPEPDSLDLLFWVTLLGFACNIAFHALFSFAGLYETLWASYVGGRMGQVGSSVGFGGNLTTNLSSYFGLMADAIGLAGATGAAYAVFAKNASFKRIVATVIWCHAIMLAYGSGTRSQVVAQGAPMVAFLALRSLREPAFRWIAACITLGLALVFVLMIQLQTHFRNQAYDISLSDQRLTSEVSGNTMFSEALDAYMEIPKRQPFFHNSYPGEGAVRALPQMGFWFVLGGVPRPLLTMVGTDKPIDPAWAYRARSMDSSGAQNNMGTTVSYGLVGSWYFRFGVAGVIEGAIVIGWLYAVAERMIRTAALGRLQLFRLIIGLTLLSTLLLFYRDVVFFGVWRGIIMFVAVGLLLRYVAPRVGFLN